MSKKFQVFSTLVTLVFVTSIFSGCTLIFQKGRRVDVEKISKLKSEVNTLEDQVDDLSKSNQDLKKKKTELELAKEELESRLKNEISDKQVKVEMMERGLVITFVAEVLFDSGKADLREDSLQKLSKVARVLNTTVKDLNVGVEGHTDNVPIKYSGWKSNWELSSARALSVLHFITKYGINPKRLAATGYGEYRPVADNSTKQGREKNRRVEIVILPDSKLEGR